MADLTYSVDALASLGRSMKRLAHDIRDDGDVAHVDIAHLSHPRVVMALIDFGDDWDDKRDSLAKHLDSVGGLAAESADTFSEVDRRLADEALEKLKTT
ncbi:hypothetical protein [Aeromicrobium fastidiosum]|uniref:ESX-1 secretion-associated protein n=1 Tax=Aeromicrobium fastidiosum TaxID=52699 RepID=A0A641AQX2_9ACTN|nr:hypothetical protein [Aeromicrobium fastidiosum]KAA1380504.1 hypothetical protein ESP62_004820 [Aeromicrobium fastidiosum]MBP2390094.1 hypothetical protein [Aeromicrobium fastidiosum]